ncbi:MAG TPA: thioredoxin family protein [Paucimonas sp.]|nr:thioredoxin family protein [Paucimonas sp.]
MTGGHAMKKQWFFLLCLWWAGGVMAAALPYDETANAGAQLSHALVQARDDHKKVLVVFGANWCPDCRRLDQAMREKRTALDDSAFVIVKVDVGNFDRNIDLVRAYGNPTRKGIPAAVILAPDQRLLYSGPLERLTSPWRRPLKIALALAAACGVVLAMAGGVMFMRRRSRARRALQAQDGGRAARR